MLIVTKLDRLGRNAMDIRKTVEQLAASDIRVHNLAPSMSQRGNVWDNVVAESFFSSLKKERIRKHIYKTRDLARADIIDYTKVFYNRARRHSHLGGVSPEAFEQASS